MGKFFESADDRDSTIVVFLVFIALVGAGIIFRDSIESESGFIIGTLLGYFGAIVQRYFKKENRNGNGSAIQPAMHPSWLEPRPTTTEPSPKNANTCPDPSQHQQSASKPEPKKTTATLPLQNGTLNNAADNKLLAAAKPFVDQVSENTPEGGKLIQKWAKANGFAVSDDGQTPWCAIFLSAMLMAAGYKPLKTMRARDYATYGDEVALNQGQPGDIWVAQAHAAIISEVDTNGEYQLLGGNQSDSVCIQPAKYYGQPIAIRRPV